MIRFLEIKGIYSTFRADLRRSNIEKIDRHLLFPRSTVMSKLSLRRKREAFLFVAVLVMVSLLIQYRNNFNIHIPIQIVSVKPIYFVSQALKNYDETHGHLPYPVVKADHLELDNKSGGNESELYSWRVELVPYLESWHGSWDPAQSWQSPANKTLIERSSFFVYHQPFLYGTSLPKNRLESFPDTNVMAITGPGTAFGDGQQCPMSLNHIPPSTILAVESRASGVPWPAPIDFDIRKMPKQVNGTDGKGISGLKEEGFHVIFADGQVWLLSHQVPFATLSQFFTIEGAKNHDRERLLDSYLRSRGLSK